MFGIGEGELLIIVAFAFMIFGPDRLPSMGRTLGRALRQFRQAQEGFNEVVQAEVMDPLQEAMGDPLDTGTRKERRAAAEKRAAALAQDADVAVADDEHAEARKETFAERKARLAQERARQAEAERAEAAEALPEQAADDTTETDVQAPAQPDQAGAVDETPAPQATSAAALYGLAGGSAYGHARRQEAAEAQSLEGQDESQATAVSATADEAPASSESLDAREEEEG